MEAGFFDLTAAAESFLLGLANSTQDAPLLLIIPRGTADFRALPPNVTCVRAEELTEQLSGRYAGVVIVPPFGEEVPDGRRLMPGTPIRRWFAEEYLIARTRQYLLPNARIVAFVSMGLLSLAQRKEALRGEDAARVLERPAFNAAMQMLKDDIVTKCAEAPVRDVEGQRLLLQLFYH